MAVWALMPVKPFATAKTRLASQLTADERVRLAKAMYLDTLSAINAASQLAGVIVVTNDATARRHARGVGAFIVDDPLHGLNLALEAGRVFAAKQGASTVLVLPSDIPAVRHDDINALTTMHASGSAVLVPDHLGTGTNALLVPDGARLPFSFGPNSRAAHCRLARTNDVRLQIVQCSSIAQDCDVPEDLDRLSTQDTGPRTRAVLAKLFERSDARFRLVS
ncbi:MAG: 2-phospho-L-lactate guanylyltransferase [Pseudomonadota bacterium]